MIGPTDLLHPSPVPHFKTFQVRKKGIGYEIFQVSLKLLSEILFIRRRTERDMIENVYWSSREINFILVRFL
jgi:hypothetical protein